MLPSLKDNNCDDRDGLFHNVKTGLVNVVELFFLIFNICVR